MRTFWYPQALAWTLVATVLVHIGAVVLLKLWPPAEFDLILLGAMQVLVYAGVISAFVSAHAENLGEDPLALAKPHLSLILLALALGISLQIPAATLVELVDKVWRTSDAELAERLARLSAPTVSRRVLMIAVVAGFGPLVEELFFRGALVAGLLKNAPRVGTAICVAACFAIAHIDPRLWPALFVVGLALSYVRIASGSLWPAFALHAAFNLTTLISVFSSPTPSVRPQSMPWPMVALGWGTSLGLLFVIRKIVLHIRERSVPSQ